MTALPRELLLGGHRAVWVWWTEGDPTERAPVSDLADLPAGVLVDHGDHTMLVPWIPIEGMQHCTLDSLLPLTVVEAVQCGACGLTGRIDQGAWLPEGVSA